MSARAGWGAPNAISWGIALAASFVAATSGSAQQAASAESPIAGAVACPSTGISIGVEGDAQADPLSTTNPAPRGAALMDTTITFSVGDRTWRWRNVVAHVSAGVAGTEGARWHVCAGAVAALREAVLTLRGVTGAIRFRADPSVLQGFRMGSDSVTTGRP